jgi:hypothetical protein
MLVDNNLLVSGSIVNGVVTGQTVTGASSVLSTNTIDLSVNRDIGEGDDIYLRAQVVTVFAGLTALNLQAIVADDAALTTNVTIIGDSGPIPVAQLPVAARFAVRINPRIASLGQRYLGARFVPTGTGTTGALMADFGLEVQEGRKFYPVGSSVI